MCCSLASCADHSSRTLRASAGWIESKAADDHTRGPASALGVVLSSGSFSPEQTNAPISTGLALKGGPFLTESIMPDKPVGSASLKGQQKGAQGTGEMGEQKGTHRWVLEDREFTVQGHKGNLVPRELWYRICTSSSSWLNGC